MLLAMTKGGNCEPPFSVIASDRRERGNPGGERGGVIEEILNTNI